MGGFAPSLNRWPGNQGTRFLLRDLLLRFSGRERRNTGRIVGAMAAGKDRHQTIGGEMTPAQRHMDKVARAGCVVCWFMNRTFSAAQVHHVAEGSGLRSDFSVAGLCEPHHSGPAGLHGMGTRAFIRLYRPPGDSEYGLLVWANELIARDMSRP